MWAADTLQLWWVFYVTAVLFVGISLFLFVASLLGF
jgi:hypothetical protein